MDGHAFVLVLFLDWACIPVVAHLPTFESFFETHCRSYKQWSSEYNERKAIYLKRVEQFEMHNNNSDRSWTASVNKLWDWTSSELSKLQGWNGHGMKWDSGATSAQSLHNSLSMALTEEQLPPQKEWKLKCLSQNEDQRSCGSCWAVAAQTILNAHSEIYEGSAARTFSAQEMVSCIPNPQECGGQGGCRGATVEMALDHVWKNGLATEAQVPYQGVDGSCRKGPAGMALLEDGSSKFLKRWTRATPAGLKFGMKGWRRLPENQYEPLLQAVATEGPVGVSVSADTWFAYGTGIFDLCQPDTVINHAVTLIGYGTDAGKKYWLIQNSWGGSWGESGRIRLLRQDAHELSCGWDNKPQDGTACRGGPSRVKVCGMCGVLYDSALPMFSR